MGFSQLKFKLCQGTCIHGKKILILLMKVLLTLMATREIKEGPLSKTKVTEVMWQFPTTGDSLIQLMIATLV